MAEKTDKIVVPSELPVLPVRDTVLFPGGVLPLTVGRESSLALLNSLQGEERLLAVVAQLDPRVEDPTEVDLHRVGTMAKLHKTVKMPNGNLVVFVEGLERIRVVSVATLKPFLRANVEPVANLIGPRDTELSALERNARELFRDVVARSPQLSDDLQTVALNIEDPVRLADFIAANLPSLTTLLRQELLETADVRRRLETLVRELSKEIEVLDLRNKIQEQVQEQVSQSQREYLLREQMKAIQKELGESDDASGGNRRTADQAGRIRHACRSAQGMRSRTQALAEDDACLGRVHGGTNLSRVDDFAPLDQVFRSAGNRHSQWTEDPGRRPLRSREGKRANTRLSGGQEVTAGNERPDPLLPGASRSRQDLARQIDRSRSRTEVRTHIPRWNA